MPKFIDGDGRAVPPHADPLLQVAWLPLTVAVVSPFKQKPQLKRDGLQGFLEFLFHYSDLPTINSICEIKGGKSLCTMVQRTSKSTSS
jgi:hypothetical protein